MPLESAGCMERPCIGVLADSLQPALIARLMSEEVFRELYPQSPPHCNYMTDCERRTTQLTLVSPQNYERYEESGCFNTPRFGVICYPAIVTEIQN